MADFGQNQFGPVLIDFSKTAIIFMDILADFFPGFKRGDTTYKAGAFPVMDAPRTVDPIMHLLRFNWALSVLAYDSHPKGHVSWKMHKKHCEKGSEGEKLHSVFGEGPRGTGKPYGWFDLAIPKGEHKDRDAYGPFVDLLGFPVADDLLNRSLKDEAIKTVVACGLESAHCEFHAVMQALHRGYEVYVPKDAVGSVTVETGQHALQRMADAGAKIIDSHQIRAV